MKLAVTLFLFLYSTLLFADEKKSPDAKNSVIQDLKQMTKNYSTSPYVHAKFKQKQLMELLGELKSSKGELYFSAQKLRVELRGEVNSTTLFTPGVITSITFDEDMTPVQVLKSKPYPHPLLSLIFGDEKAWDDFEITEIIKNSKTKFEAQLSPKDPKKIPGIDRIEVVLNKKKFELQKITYWDDLGNQTTNEFVSQKKSTKVDGEKFVLIPPNNVEVKNL